MYLYVTKQQLLNELNITSKLRFNKIYRHEHLAVVLRFITHLLVSFRILSLSRPKCKTISKSARQLRTAEDDIGAFTVHRPAKVTLDLETFQLSLLYHTFHTGISYQCSA